MIKTSITLFLFSITFSLAASSATLVPVQNPINTGIYSGNDGYFPVQTLDPYPPTDTSQEPYPLSDTHPSLIYYHSEE